METGQSAQLPPLNGPPTQIDLLIEPEWVIPIEPAGEVLKRHSIAVNDGRIIALLPSDDTRNRYKAREERRLPGHVVIPGLVNLHTHAAMTLLRGYADDKPLEQWLRDHIWPAEARFVSPDFVTTGSQLACLEMLSGGITCFNDMYFFPEQTAEIATSLGMRAVIGLIALEFPSRYASGPDEYIAKGTELYDQWKDSRLISFAMAPHAPYSVSNATFDKIRRLSDQIDIPVHVHLHETRSELVDSVRDHGCRPIARLETLGLINSRTIAVHSVHLEDHELDLFAARGVSVAHCPVSNLKLGSGIANIPGMLSRGIKLGLGTDGAASNNRLDMWQEVRQAALLAKATTNDASCMGAHQALYAATLGSAKALRLDHEIGSISVGKAADLIAVKLDDLLVQPCFDPASHLVYVTGREHVTDVWVAGKCRKFASQPIESTILELPAQVELWHTRVKLSH